MEGVGVPTQLLLLIQYIKNNHKEIDRFEVNVRKFDILSHKSQFVVNAHPPT